MNRLYFGDNLHVLREHVADESVDLFYLDPPFNSRRGCNLLFKTPKGHQSDAQITAFEDCWRLAVEAVKEGFYISPATGAEFPRIQILTIKGLLDGGERARFPDLAQGGHTFKKARREQGKAYQGGLF